MFHASLFELELKTCLTYNELTARMIVCLIDLEHLLIHYYLTSVKKVRKNVLKNLSLSLFLSDEYTQEPLLVRVLETLKFTNMESSE
jgi:hypothetical protein